MAIDTTNKKLSLLHWSRVWEAALPTSPSTLGQDDKQQLLWGYPGVLWSVQTQPTEFEDLTTVFIPYVENLHALTLAQHDSDTLIANDLARVRAATNYPDLNTQYVADLS